MYSVADDVARITQQQHMQRLQIEKIAREKQLEIWAAHWQQQGFSPEEIQVPPPSPTLLLTPPSSSPHPPPHPTLLLTPPLSHLPMPNVFLRLLATPRCSRWRRPPLPPPTPPRRTCRPPPPKLLQQPPPPR